MTAPAWNLDRVEATRPELAPLVRLHRALAAASAAFVARCPVPEPTFAEPPAIHWLRGRALLDASGGWMTPRLVSLFAELARAAAETTPGARAALGEILAATGEPTFDWSAHAANFRELAPDLPHAALFRFLLFRTAAVPAAHLARTFSAPHADRWRRSNCPWCGIPAAAAVAGAGGARTLLCVLCGGRWQHEGRACIACGEERPDTQMFLADRALGPASLEGCATCRHAIKVFAAVDLPDEAPIALEILTVHLDVIAQSDDLARDPTALAAIFPPP